MTEGPDDDLATWADDDLVRALRAPGTATELADQDEYVAAFRTASRSNVRSLPRRAASRLGVGGTAVVVTVALTSGVAAAYTGHLPDPVQRLAHNVIGAIGVAPPAAPGRHHPEAGPTPGGTASSQQPSAPSSSEPSSTPSAGSGQVTTAPIDPGSAATPGGHPAVPGTAPSQGSGGAPSDGPTTGPTTTPTSSAGVAAAAMSMSAPARRVGLGQTVVVTGLVTDASGDPVPDHGVVLQVRGARHWRPVEQATTDDTGLASLTTPPVTRSARFRWHADRGVHSPSWLLTMVPGMTVSAQVEGGTTTISPVAQGSSPGDRVQLFRHARGHTALVRQARLDASGSVAMPVPTPRRHAVYVVRLLRTRRHAAVRARVLVVPPAPSSVSISGSASRVAPGSTVVIGGTVTSTTGAVLPGHQVVLLVHGPARWRPVGHAVSDASGQVSLTTPPVTTTARFRLRTDHRAHSVVWRVVEVPTLSASAQRGATTVDVGVSVTGARPGDKVVLLRRVGGRLVHMRRAPLSADGSVGFVVPARKTRTVYVVRLAATPHHGPASATVVVPKG